MGLTKLKLIAYKKEDYSSGSKAGEFDVLINPETYSREFSFEYNESQGFGGAGAEMKYHKKPPDTISFDLIFDGTGLVPTAPVALQGKSVKEQIELFQKTAMYFDGSIHRPYFLRLLWGMLEFEGVLTSVNFQYSLFDNSGNPVRAKATANFKSSVSPETAAKIAGKESPDLTHLREMQEGVSLFQMSDKIYNDPSWYMAIARFNDLDQFRQIKPGTQLSFPPLEKLEKDV